MRPQQIVEVAARALEAQRGGLALIGPNGTPVVPLAGSPLTPDDARRLIELEAAAHEVWAVGSALMAVLVVPVRRQTEVLGVLYVASEHRGSFTAADERVLLGFADLIAAELDQASIAADVLRRGSWVEASQGVLLALLDGAEPRETLHVVAERARAAAGAAAAGIAMPDPHDPDTLVFDVVTAPGLDVTPLRGLTVSLRQTATGASFESGDPVVVRDYGGWVLRRWGEPRPPWAPLVEDLDAAVAVPLTVADERLGVLAVMRRRGESPFTDGEVEDVQRYATDAALAVRFAQARDDRERVQVSEERERIARDLHDVVIQRLFATGLGLMGASRKIADPTLAAQVAASVEAIDESMLDLRSSIFAIRRSPHHTEALRVQVLELAHESAEVGGLNPRISLDGPLESAVPETMWPDVLAVMREALANATRHAGATSVAVSIVVDTRGEQLTIAVIDDGVGPLASETRSSGLANLSGRAARWGGTCELLPGGAGGAELRWSVPLSSSRQDEIAGGGR